ncbi:Slp family lipoprotein [Halomonas denitrificans]|nr:Slp family lipoprotein [Halomonas denitrificans]
MNFIDRPIRPFSLPSSIATVSRSFRSTTVPRSRPESPIRAARTRLLLPALLAVVLLAAGCATSPFSGAGPVVAKGPADALRGEIAPGERVLWGGRIVGVVNASDVTELEILALPLDRADRPRASAEGGVRFVVRYPGFLEPVNYAPGRLLTALGRFTTVETRTVGEFDIEQPVIDARQVELWPVRDPRPQTQFGIGVGIRL